MTTSAPPGAANAPADADTTVWFALSTDEALAKQGVDRAQGLAAAENAGRLAGSAASADRRFVPPASTPISSMSSASSG